LTLKFLFVSYRYMKKQLRGKSGNSQKIASPETVLAAAKRAPRVFSIGAYFRPIYEMRQKGYSWRYLAEWLQQFNISISFVQLSRLYAAEDERLSLLSRQELNELGMPEEMIQNFITKDDPSKRLPSRDAEDIADEIAAKEEEQRERNPKF